MSGLRVVNWLVVLLLTILALSIASGALLYGRVNPTVNRLAIKPLPQGVTDTTYDNACLLLGMTEEVAGLREQIGAAREAITRQTNKRQEAVK